jgi:beta-glucosidase
LQFPNDFIWGTATASYQIEGAAMEDGRGECIWTRFSHTPGKIVNGENGDVACNHYNLYQDDINLMAELGLDAYRLSISWPRILANGRGSVNEKGMDFYDRLIDALLNADITPYVTLYHWDLPQALQDEGGWANRDIIKWYADYVSIVANAFGDRVQNWITLNEPWVISFLGYYTGEHAPGLTDLPTALKVAHHLMLSHAEAVPILRELPNNPQVGITLDLHFYEPASDSPEDIQACALEEGWKNGWFLDPLFKGHYPAHMVEAWGDNLREVDVDEISAAKVPLDFLGVNYYMRNRLQHAPDGKPLPTRHAPPRDSDEVTEMNWIVYPDGLRQTLLRWTNEYGIPAFYITENGAAYDDPLPQNGSVTDPARVAYLKGHLEAINAAIAEGVPLKGYFVWSFMDNFEWAFGYSRRFGIIHVDYETQIRTLKDSARYYQRAIAANAVVEI